MPANIIKFKRGDCGCWIVLIDGKECGTVWKKSDGKWHAVLNDGVKIARWCKSRREAAIEIKIETAYERGR